jgi:flagellar basal body rod protein FlgB
MSLFSVFNVSGSALNAETIRLNTTASNLANAESVDGDPSKVYRGRHAVFQTMMDQSDTSWDGADASAGVRVLGVVESTTAPTMRYQPDHPKANKDRRDDQHDLGQPLVRDQCRGDQYGAGLAPENHLHGSLKDIRKYL